MASKLSESLIAFESFKWTDNNYKHSRTTKNSKSLENETFAIACTGTRDRVVALQNSSNQMNLPVIRSIREIKGIDQSLPDGFEGEIVRKI